VAYYFVADSTGLSPLFSRCCLPNVRNRAKLQVNSNL